MQGGVPPLLVRSTAATEEGAGEAEPPQHLFDASRASLPMARGHAEVALSVSALSDACHGSIFCVGLMPHAPELRVPYLLAFSQPFRSVGSDVESPACVSACNLDLQVGERLELGALRASATVRR